jgi:hypothetical protein
MGGWAVEESWLAHAKMAGSERTCHELAKSVPILTPLLKNSKVSGIGREPLEERPGFAGSPGGQRREGF